MYQVAQIQELIPAHCLRHVSSADNRFSLCVEWNLAFLARGSYPVVAWTRLATISTFGPAQFRLHTNLCYLLGWSEACFPHCNSHYSPTSVGSSLSVLFLEEASPCDGLCFSSKTVMFQKHSPAWTSHRSTLRTRSAGCWTMNFNLVQQ